MSKSIRFSTKLLLFLIATISLSTLLPGQTPPTLGTTATYGAFTSVGEINNTGLTQLNGDIGTNAGDFSGFPPGVYTGAKHVADPASLTAKNDLTTAWNQMGVIPCDAALSVTIGNGQVLTPKTYCVGEASTITGDLTLDAQGNPNAIFIIKVGGALNVAATSKIILANLAQAANVYWRIDGAVSILDNSVFKGTIVANGAIHLYGGTTLEGRALSIVGAITMASNMITVPVAAPPGSLTVVRPATGDTLIAGTQGYQIGFVGVNVTLRKTLEYSLDGGATWNIIGVMRSAATSYSWNVPTTPSNQALVRITDSNGITGTSGMFVIKTSTSPGSIIVVRPAAGDTIIAGTQNYQIAYTGVNLAQRKTFEYSLDGGATWNTIGVDRGSNAVYSWNVPATPSNRALVRITDSNGVTGTSGMFVIKMNTTADGSINSLTLAGVVNNKIGNNMPINISWTFTPDIGTSVDVEYSLDGGSTWSLIATVPTSAPPTVMWTTPASGFYSSALIRVTSTLGMRRVSEAFSIGSIAGVRENGSASGYTISNYPNPVSSATTIRFELPTRSFVKIAIVDGQGRDAGTVAWRIFEAGDHVIPFDASQLSSGVYTYTLDAGKIRVSGSMTIVK